MTAEKPSFFDDFFDTKLKCCLQLVLKTKIRSAFKEITSDYPGIKYHVLPSPSPRYARMNKEEKINHYRDLLPKV